MKLARWLETPPPTTAWSLDGAAVVAVRRDGRGVFHGALQEVPDGTFELGPVGLQTVDPARLEPLVRSVQERMTGANRPAVVLPTGWLRSHLLDFDQLPRKQGEIEDVVRWRLKRLLPVPPADLRLSWIQLAAAGGARRLVTVVGLRRAIDTLEASFEALGLQPGLITSRVFALAAAPLDGDTGPRLIVQGEPGYVSLLLVVEGVPRLLRTKPLSGAETAEPAAVLRRELDLTLRFIRETLEIADPLVVSSSASDEAVTATVAAWTEQESGLTVAPGPDPVHTAEADVMAAIGRHRLAPLRMVVGGVA